MHFNCLNCLPFLLLPLCVPSILYLPVFISALSSACAAVTSLILNGQCYPFFQTQVKCTSPPGTLVVRDHSLLGIPIPLLWGESPFTPGKLAAYKFAPNIGQSSFNLRHRLQISAAPLPMKGMPKIIQVWPLEPDSLC